MDLAVDVRLADPPGDQLGVLGAEIDDQDAVVMLAVDGVSAARYGVTRSDRYRSSTTSRARATHQRPSSTTTSAGRGRVL